MQTSTLILLPMPTGFGAKTAVELHLNWHDWLLRINPTEAISPLLTPNLLFLHVTYFIKAGLLRSVDASQRLRYRLG